MSVHADDEPLPAPYDPKADLLTILEARLYLTNSLLNLADEHRLDELDEALELISKRVGDVFPDAARALAGGLYVFRTWARRQGRG